MARNCHMTALMKPPEKKAHKRGNPHEIRSGWTFGLGDVRG